MERMLNYEWFQYTRTNIYSGMEFGQAYYTSFGATNLIAKNFSMVKKVI